MIKRGQLKIQQMAFMLIAITLFFALVGVLILSVGVSNIREKASLLEQENAMLLVSRIANSPEFSCSNSAGGSEIACVDGDKVMILKNNIDKYSGFWDVESIEIRKIYPESDNKECTSSIYPDCNRITVLEGEGGIGVSNFVSLCRKENFEGEVYNKCELAKVIISYEDES